VRLERQSGVEPPQSKKEQKARLKFRSGEGCHR
jgi:hypothetical protein